MIEQQVNSLLVENAIYFDENFILPKSECLCLIRYIEDEGMARGSEEMQHMEQGVMITGACAREEQDKGATQQENIIRLKMQKTAGLSGLHPPDCPGQPECPGCASRNIRPTSRAKCDNVLVSDRIRPGN